MSLVGNIRGPAGSGGGSTTQFINSDGVKVVNPINNCVIIGDQPIDVVLSFSTLNADANRVYRVDSYMSAGESLVIVLGTKNVTIPDPQSSFLVYIYTNRIIVRILADSSQQINSTF